MASRGTAVGCLALVVVSIILLGGSSPSPEPPKASASPPHVRQRGQWEVAYFPGRAEEPWTTLAFLNRTCRFFSRPEYARVQHEALSEAARHWTQPEDLARTTVERGAVLSQIAYCPLGSGRAAQGGGHGCRVEYIEPLGGTGRHPFADVYCDKLALSLGHRMERKVKNAVALMRKSRYNISHLILGSRCGGKGAVSIHSGRNVLIDAGCSVWGGSRWQNERVVTPAGVINPPALSGSGLGPSMPLFYDLFSTRCAIMDEIHGFEARPFDATEWYSHVPASIQPRVHFHNVPISADDQQKDTDPLRLIAKVASVDDFVVFKLDIDMFTLERAVVDEIITNRRGTNASLLIDEVLFEYHFATPKEPGKPRLGGPLVARACSCALPPFPADQDCIATGRRTRGAAA